MTDGVPLGVEKVVTTNSFTRQLLLAGPAAEESINSFTVIHETSWNWLHQLNLTRQRLALTVVILRSSFLLSQPGLKPPHCTATEGHCHIVRLSHCL